jgi:putative NADPH-quinone reductase
MRVLAVHAPTAGSTRTHDAFTIAVSAALSAGHDVVPIDLAADGFVPVMSAEEHAAYHGGSPLITEETRRSADAVMSADAFVFVYPTTFSTIPVVLKGWFERVFVPGVSFVLDPRTHKVRRNLTGVRRIVGIATYDGSRGDIRRSRDNGRRTIQRALRMNTGMRTRTSWIPLYDAGRADPSDVDAFHARIEKRMERL